MAEAGVRRGVRNIPPEKVCPAVFLSILISVCVVMCLADVVCAVDVEAGLNWIESRQEKNGSWNNSVRDGVEILKVLHYFDRRNSPAFDRGVQWLRTIEPENTDILARKIEGLYLADPTGTEFSKLADQLMRGQNEDFGWGENKGHFSNMLSTYVALRALLAVGLEEHIITKQGLASLLFQQNKNGSWSIIPGGKESTFLTASILSLLSDHERSINHLYTSLIATNPGFTDLDLPIQRAVSWLLTTQKADGGWGDEGSSSIQESALVFEALTKNGILSPAIDRALNFIKSKAATENWSSDPYLTAVSLKAIGLDGRADLSIKEIVLGNQFPALDDTLTATVIVSNLGKVAVPLVHADVLDGRGRLLVHQQPIGNIGPGETSNFRFHFLLAEEGENEVTVVLDSAHLVVESSKSNNTLTKHFKVLTPFDVEILHEDVEFRLSDGTLIPPDRLSYGMDVYLHVAVHNRGGQKVLEVPLIVGIPSIIRNTYILQGLQGGDATPIILNVLRGHGETNVILPWKVNVVGNVPILIRVPESRVEKNQSNNVAHVNLKVVQSDRLVPLPPSGLTCSVDDNRQIHLSWALNRESDVAGYLVYRNGKLASLTNITSEAHVEGLAVDVLPSVLADGNAHTGWHADPSSDSPSLIFTFDHERSIASVCGV